MSHKMTNDEFKSRANKMHNNFYDYSKTDYHDIKSSVTITCPIHGDFTQRAETHLLGHGCPKCAAKRREATMLAVHGTSHAMQSDAVKGKATATKLARFGQKKPPNSGKKQMTKDEFVTRAREIHGDKYDYSKVVMAGSQTKVEIICPDHGSFLQTPAKHLSGRGCSHPDCIRAKKIATNMAKYGVENYAQLNKKPLKPKKQRDYAVEQAKREATMIARYGSPNPMQVEEIKSRHEETCMEHFGTPTPLSSLDVRTKIEETMIATYGGKSAMCDPAVREKSRFSCLETYGEENPMKSPDVQAKLAETMQNKYGATNAMLVKDIQERQHAIQVETMKTRYGVNSSFESPELRAKAEATCIRKYGKPNAMQCRKIVERMLESKRRNGTSSTSKPEEDLYLMLVRRFGEDDVIRQHVSEQYPSACDFYIPSRNMYIELNGCAQHSVHWFGRDGDDEILNLIAAKDTAWYDSVIDTWTRRDVAKRNIARENNLNYVVFWDDRLRDAELWFAMGCPDGHDWEQEYSWIPDRMPAGCELYKLTKNVNHISMIAKHFQFNVFYERELNLWSENGFYRGLPFQVFMYYNRFKHINREYNKTPDKLRDVEIVRGIGIAKVINAYTSYDISLMQHVIDKYHIKSIYDPCAGWGERMLCCHLNHIPYLGVDINEKLFPGYAAMWSHYNMIDQYVQQGDSAFIDISGRDYDAVLTCPPYGNTEIYSEAGAENLSKDDFLAWWTRVVLNSININPRLFCFQVNQKWKQEMADIVRKCGFDLVEEIDDRVKSSHMNRGEDGVSHKKEKETMLVFRNTSGGHRM